MESDEITFKQILSNDIKPGMIVIDPEEYKKLLETTEEYKRQNEELKEYIKTLEDNAWERDTYD